MRRCTLIHIVVGGLATAGALAAVQSGDLAIGLSRPMMSDSLQIARGQPTGSMLPDTYEASFTQSVEFDNLGGSHSPNGNLLGISFGPAGGSGVIQWFPTSTLAGGGIQIGDTVGFGGAGLTPSRLGGLSVAPNNARIAVSGYDGGRIYCYDYAPGDGAAVPSALSGGRETAPGVSPSLNTFGTTWYNNETILAFGADGNLRRIDANTLAVSDLASVTGLTYSTDGTNTAFTDIEYNPRISPYVLSSHSRLEGGVARNHLIAFDPTTWAVVQRWQFLGLRSTREIAFGPDGALYVSEFGGASVGGSVRVARLANAASLQIGDPTIYYASAQGFPAPFSGLDIALPEPAALASLALLAVVAMRRR